MPRSVFLLGIGLCLIALALITTDWLLGLQPGVTEANVKRIRKGMGEEEVGANLGRAADATTEDEEFESLTEFEELVEEIEDALGVPPGSTLRPGNSGKGWRVDPWPVDGIDWEGLSIRTWNGAGGDAKVLFLRGRVLLAAFFPSAPPGIVERLRSQFGQ
jgi:hypothetical protein